jgi:phosphoglycerol transferase MdoB-like AlkP superfamily enzyme
MESFFDVNRLKDVTYSTQPMPNYTNLIENYTSGYLTVPSIGAGTANTEFEVLSGMSLAYFGMGEYPYKSVLRDDACESLATMFKDYGYAAHAVHNHSGTFYARHTVYPNLGFDTFISSEFMLDLERNVLTWAKDKVLLRYMKEALNSTKETDFVYAVTAQAHGNYPKIFVQEASRISVSGDLNEEDKNKYTYYI